MAELDIAFRLPVSGWPRAVFETNYSFRGGRLVFGGDTVVEAASRDELERGVRGALPSGEPIELALAGNDAAGVSLRVGDHRALREDGLRRGPSPSAWRHAFIALAASFAGFVASYLYLSKSSALDGADAAWSHKMAVHMAAWHLLLTFTLFPASVWGQRIGIRIVQFVSFVFFGIHVGIAIANAGMEDAGIFAFNTASGVLFLVSTFYGNVAHRDMDPVAALERAPAPR